MIRTLICWLILMASACAAQERVALVLGNSSYHNAGTLKNAMNDARDVSHLLKSLGFIVFDGFDLTRAETLHLAAKMARRLGTDDIALVFYAGHGVQVGTKNYLLPVDAMGQDYEAIKQSSVSLQAVLREIELRAQTNIVLLDACRTNPFQQSLQTRTNGPVAVGLARVDAAIGSFIAFSTQPGNVAFDGTTRNSPFTSALLQHLPNDGDDLHEIMRKVRRQVVAETDNLQVPWENSSLIDKVYLARRSAPAALPKPDLIQPVVPQTPTVQVPPQPVPPAPQMAPTHLVQGLDPQGDGFLALRDGGYTGARLLARMPEGTQLRVLAQNGAWMQVQTSFGMTGWAHGNWIRPVGAPARTSAAGCDDLWYQRNAIFAQRGYCFQSARGQSTFGNAGCLAGVPASGIPLTPQERAQVSALKAQEQIMGCR